MPQSRRLVRFGSFEADLDACQLQKRGAIVHLPLQAFQVLRVLIENPGRVVTRDELRRAVWAADTFVEFDRGLNNAISRVRDVLGDSATSPRFVETVPRKGYRFIAPVESPGAPLAPPADSPLSQPRPEPPPALRRTSAWVALGALALAAAGAFASWLALSPRSIPVSAEQRIVAVLPFVAGDASDGSVDTYVAFGMTEALMTELSRAGSLKVISQTSAIQYKDVRKPLKQIAAELGAGTIVEGSVVREGDHVRITVQLIDARTDTHLWAQSYPRESATVLSGQRELAREVAGIVRSRLLPDDRTASPLLGRTNPAAYEAYVKGRYFLQQPSEDAWQKSRQFFEQAIAADPAFAPAHVGLSQYWGITDRVPPVEAMAKAKASALRALALDEHLAAAHASLAYVHYFGDWDWIEAERSFARAIELDPSDSWSRRWHALYLSAIGRSADAIAEIRRAIELDPISVSAYDAAGAIYFDARQYDKIVEQAQKINDLSPNDPRALIHFATAYFHQGKVAQALEFAQKGAAASARNAAFLCVLAGAQHRAGLTADAEKTLAEVNQQASQGYVPDVFLALATLWMHGPDDALPFLQRAFERRDSYIVILKSSPWFDPMRSHPGYQDLVRRMNFPG